MKSYFDDFFKFIDPAEHCDMGAFGSLLVEAFSHCVPNWHSIKFPKKMYPFIFKGPHKGVSQNHSPSFSPLTTTEFDATKREAIQKEKSLICFVLEHIHHLNSVHNLIGDSNVEEKQKQEFLEAKSYVQGLLATNQHPTPEEAEIFTHTKWDEARRQAGQIVELDIYDYLV